MSNKSNDTMDGVFEISPADKPATVADKPARPPKPKVSLSRETKVGLAVVGALLLIFIVVLVIRLRGDGEDQVAENASPQADAPVGEQRASKEKRDASSSGAMVAPAKSGNGGASQFWDGQSSTQANRTQGQSVYGAAGTSVYGGAGNTSTGSAADRFGTAPQYGQSVTDREESTGATNVTDGSDNAPPQPSPFGFKATAAQAQQTDLGQGSAFQGARTDPFAVRSNAGAAAAMEDESGVAVSDDSETDAANADAGSSARSAIHDESSEKGAGGPTFFGGSRPVDAAVEAASDDSKIDNAPDGNESNPAHGPTVAGQGYRFAADAISRSAIGERGER